MRLIEDLGRKEYGTQGQKTRFGLYECPVCLKHFICRCSNVKQGITTKCKQCHLNTKGAMRTADAANNFIDKAIQIHGDIYDYSKVVYVNSSTKVVIICNKHGEFTQTPNGHICGRGCQVCAGNKKRTTEQFIQRAEEIHGTKYEYNNSVYTSLSNKVEIICKEHGKFIQHAGSHIKGSGCPSCAKYGFDPTKSAIVYYLRVSSDDKVLYKIGVTNSTVQERFQGRDITKITILEVWDYQLGLDAYNHEQQILKQYKDYKYIGEPLLSSGNTELFTSDVLGLDNY